MYMGVLEQEVEALSAEVTRLRLMVHRITQVMEAPPANRHAHVEPMHTTTSLSHHAASTSADGSLQATVDSYKQLLPLVQLLLAQQHRGHANTAVRASSTDSESRRQEKSSSRRRHRHRRSHRTPTSSSGISTSSSRRPSGAAFSSQPSSGGATASSGAPVQPTPTTPQRTEQTAAAASLAEMQLLSPSSKQAAVQATRPKSGSVVDRLRAQRGLTAAADDSSSSSTNSSDAMPAFTSQTRSVTTSGFTTGERSHATGGVAPASGTVKAKHMDALHGLSSHPKPSQSLMSSRLLDAPMASSAVQGGGLQQPRDSIRSASIAAEDVGYYQFSPVVSILDISHEGPEIPLQSQSGVPPASARHGPSTANSVEFSEQGRYEYSALGSLANSPAQSHLPDDGYRSARTGTATAASTALDVSPAGRPPHQQQQQHHVPHHGGKSSGGGGKALPAHSSVTMRPGGVFSDSSSSSDDDGGAAQTPVAMAASFAARSFGTSVVLGARRPISAHSPSSSTGVAVAPAFSSTMGRAASIKAAPSANLQATLRSLNSTDSSSDTTSSSSAAVAAAVFHRSQTRQAPKEDHKESSFHNYSEAASSPPGSHLAVLSPQRQQRQQRQQPAHDVAASSASQDVLGSTTFSIQRSAKGSPHQREKERRREMEASGELSRVLSHSVSRPQTAHSESVAASSLGRRGSLASGGYYYGYDFGMGSPSQQSVVSNGADDNGTPSSPPGYDY